MPLKTPEEGVQPIKAFRRWKRNLRQDEVADAIDIGAPEYSRIENGIRLPTVHQYDELCRLLKAKPEQLFSRHVIAEMEERRRRAATA